MYPCQNKCPTFEGFEKELIEYKEKTALIKSEKNTEKNEIDKHYLKFLVENKIYLEQTGNDILEKIFNNLTFKYKGEVLQKIIELCQINIIKKIPRRLLNKEILGRLNQDSFINFSLTSKESFLNSILNFPKIPLAAYESTGVKKFKEMMVTYGKKITSLNLKGIDYNNFDVAELTTNCLNLTSLSVQSDLISDTSLKEIATLKSLRKLDLSRCKEITDKGLQELAKLEDLQELNLSYCSQIADKELQELAKLKNLRKLNLFDCSEINDEGLQKLASLKSLRKLDLSWCKKITDKGLQELAKLDNLQELNLVGYNEITDEGLQELVKLKSLRKLDLSFCKKITDKGLQELAKLEDLQELNLSGCNEIKDEGLQELAKLKSLQKLSLWWCTQITGNGLQGLAIKSLPKLEIILNGPITNNKLQIC